MDLEINFWALRPAPPKPRLYDATDADKKLWSLADVLIEKITKENELSESEAEESK